SAYYLRQRGADVVILERERVGSGASRGNAGEICPSGVEPLAAPGMIGESVRSGLRHGGALSLRPLGGADVVRFALRFASLANERDYQRGFRALAGLARRTYNLYDGLAEDGIGSHRRADGYLYCCSTREAAEHHRAALDPLVEEGLAEPPGPVLVGKDLRDLEPAVGEGVRAGFLLPNERWIDPSRFVDDLAGALARMGVRIVEGAAVASVQETGAGVTVSGPFGAEEGSAALIAGGARSKELLSTLGLRTLLQPGKGYSFSVMPDVMPAHAFYIPDAHVAATPMGQRLRIAGTMQMDGTYDRFDRRRIAHIVSAVRPYVSGVNWDARADEWVGPRPMTPDGLPMLGLVPGWERTFVAAGHNMIGLTLAPTTGLAMADLITGNDPGIDLSAMAPGRASVRARPRFGGA
ncbi:MAG: D-amino-acid dehydrogenase, partial [Actinomycetota bacterium]|nr:D-amino-acid dehydrogenase [Actinomycetota bacterium]